jgi:hypothetical protein
MASFNDTIIEQFRAGDGVLGGHWEGKTTLLLHTPGRKSGKVTVNPLVARRVARILARRRRLRNQDRPQVPRRRHHRPLKLGTEQVLDRLGQLSRDGPRLDHAGQLSRDSPSLIMQDRSRVTADRPPLDRAGDSRA